MSDESNNPQLIPSDPTQDVIWRPGDFPETHLYVSACLSMKDAAERLLNVLSVFKADPSIEEARKEAEAIRREAERQEIVARMAERQSKVAQEIAIARRIETSEEVEMEEFFDLSADGHAGFKAEGGTVSLGAGVEGAKVSRRVLRFRGILSCYKRRAGGDPQA